MQRMTGVSLVIDPREAAVDLAVAVPPFAASMSNDLVAPQALPRREPRLSIPTIDEHSEDHGD
jgi:hypothetical protein